MSAVYVVKRGDNYVAYPSLYGPCPLQSTEWTQSQRHAWRWIGTESGNGARLAARALDGRIVRLRKPAPPLQIRR